MEVKNEIQEICQRLDVLEQNQKMIMEKEKCNNNSNENNGDIFYDSSFQRYFKHNQDTDTKNEDPTPKNEAETKSLQEDDNEAVQTAKGFQTTPHSIKNALRHHHRHASCILHEDKDSITFKTGLTYDSFSMMILS